MGCVYSACQFVLWRLWEYVLFILLSSSKREYDPLAIVLAYIMKQWYTLYVFLYSYGTLRQLVVDIAAKQTLKYEKTP